MLLTIQNKYDYICINDVYGIFPRTVAENGKFHLHHSLAAFYQLLPQDGDRGALETPHSRLVEVSKCWGKGIRLKLKLFWTLTWR